MQACLLDVPELRHSIEDTPHPRGEIAVRTPNMFKGYDGMDSSASCVTLDGERYYRTGDLGEARVNPFKCRLGTSPRCMPKAVPRYSDVMILQ